MSLCSNHKHILKSASPTKCVNILTENKSYLPKDRKIMVRSPEISTADFDHFLQNQDPQNLYYPHPNTDGPKCPICLNIYPYTSFGPD